MYSDYTFLFLPVKISYSEFWEIRIDTLEFTGLSK